MRSSAETWSTTTLLVSGSFLPLAMIDSSRSTRKMMSMRRASCSLNDGDPSDYGTRRTARAALDGATAIAIG